jgi:hypothetical protein
MKQRKMKAPADTSGRIVQLAVDNPIATHEELAAANFAPEQFFVGFANNPTAQEEHEEKLRSIGVASRMAGVMLGNTKAELIDLVRHMDKDKDEESGSMGMLEFLTDARNKLEALLAFVTAAEIRHASAMACVYRNDADNLPPVPKPPAPEIGERHRRELGL